ncbi:PTS sugar transporter subunit IIC [Paenibacillus oralis]|uniref:PTS sugar transporter subunit IIC n=1 Tax=Paenibacillus oralis TaxID=2490856 RepID=A0A3P3U112_9BACL|nr:PTS transporter subunit EIIC [Paenibacillus oralis]RRJ63268.1 PTS sugar transporter subunit IIC [Paenibacillus oralis]
MDDKTLAGQIVELSGGSGNFDSLTNCMTRVRIKYKDNSKVELEKIKELKGVLGIIEEDSTQIVVGPGHSNKVREEMEKIINSSSIENKVTEPEESKEKKKGFLKMISNIFVPILPGIIASGIIQGVNNMITNSAAQRAAELGIKGTDALTAQQVVLDSWHILQLSTLLSILGAATFSFLAIYTGIMAAREFKTDMILGGVLGAVSISGSLLGDLGLSNGQGGLFGVIFGVYLLSVIQKLLRKVVPNILDVVVTPTLTLLITSAIFLLTVMPLAGILSDWIINGILALLEFSGILGGFVLAALFPSLIATGLHHSLSAIHAELLNTLGVDPVFPVQIMSNAGMVGAGLAIYFLTKNKKTKEIAKGAIPTSFLAVGEPTMYGVVLPSGFGFITGSIGAGIGGIMIRLFDVNSTAFGSAGMSAIPLIANGDYLQYLISYVIGCCAAFVLTYVVGKAKRYS